MFRFSMENLVSRLVFFMVAHVVVSVPARVLRSPCDPDRVKVCIKSLTDLNKGYNFGLIQGNHDVIDICREIQAAIVCVQDFVRDCFPTHSNAKDGFGKIISGVVNFSEQLCDVNSELHKDYISNEKCISTITDDSCITSMKETLDRLGHSSMDPYQRLEATCCAVKKNMDCTVGVFMSKCGPGAARLIDTAQRLLHGNLITDECKSSSKCPDDVRPTVQSVLPTDGNSVTTSTQSTAEALTNSTLKNMDEYRGKLTISSALTVRPSFICFSLVTILWAVQRKFL